MNSKILLLGIALSTFIVHSSSEKILFLIPVSSRSHVHVFEPLMKELGRRGHEILALSPTHSKGMPPSVRQVQLITVEDLTGDMPNMFEMRRMGILKAMTNSSSWDHMNKACIKALTSPKLDAVLKEKFDLVIVDIFFNNCVLGLIPHFKAHSIFLTTSAAPSPMSLNTVGNRLPLSHVPSFFVDYTDKMNFKERLINTGMDFIFYAFWQYFMVQGGETMYREHLPFGKDLPSVYDIYKDASMLFMNSHFSMSYPRALLPDAIEVGGMHVGPAKPLPKDLDEFLSDSGEHGFIFFSLGSIVKPEEMPEETKKVFLKVFSKLKQRVLWKWATETMPDVPPNVMLRKWLPQQDILGHPNIKLFMSHGGLLSTQESVYHGVPIMGLPIGGDQDLNVAQAEKAGYAKFVEILDLTEERLEEAILELLNNPKYSQRVKELSKVVKDRPQTPLETATYWTEYVLRHNGAPHLRSAARDLNFIQYYVLDVIAVISVVVALAFYLVITCCKAVCRKCCGRGNQENRKHYKKD